MVVKKFMELHAALQVVKSAMQRRYRGLGCKNVLTLPQPGSHRGFPPSKEIFEISKLSRHPLGKVGRKRGKSVPRPCGDRDNEAFEELEEGQGGCSRKNRRRGPD